MTQITKTQQIKQYMDRGDTKRAISIASRFFDKSECTEACKVAQSALLNPSFYRQMGKDPFLLYDKAIALLRQKFCDEEDEKCQPK